MTNVITRRIVSMEPYPGLRPFRPDEAHLFFGREAQVDKLLEKIQESHFVAVIGPSGCGKSSLVKAGLIPELKTGMLINEALKCHIVETHPGDAPYKNLAASLHETICAGSEPACINAELKRSHKGLAQALKYEINADKENVLLVVDQFEELFRYRQNNNIDEVMAYISLLIYAAQQEEIKIHVVITMRSDFLGECSLFPGLPEMLNDNQFLTPRLTREQLKEAIESPALVCGGSLDALLVNTLLNDIGVDHDQLPLLQHVLKRMWVLKKETLMRISSQDNGVNHETIHNKIHLELKDYENVGKLNNALSGHANLLYDNELNDEQKHITEVMFTRMSERSADRKDVRKPVQIREIAEIAKVNAKEVIKVADYFREAEYNFISPPADIPLKEDSFIDISHESIIRQWDKMKTWLEKEYDASTRYVRWIADARDYFRGEGELLSGIDLKYILEWNSSDKVNGAWALRYGSDSDFEMVGNYIRLGAKENARLMRKKRMSKMLGYGLMGLITVLTITMAYFMWKNQQAEQAAIRSQLRTDSIEYAGQITRQNAAFEARQFQIASESSEKEKELKRIQMDSINEKNKTIKQQNQVLSQQYDELQQRNIIREIQLQPVYGSLDGQDREMAEKVLVPLYQKADSTRINQFIREITRAKWIEENKYKQDPDDNFYEAIKLWRDTKSPLVSSILIKGLNKNLYYKQTLSLNRRLYDRYTFVFSADNKSYALATGLGLSLGTYLNGELRLERSLGGISSISAPIAEMAGSGKRILALSYSSRRLLALWDQDGQLVEYSRNGARRISNIADVDVYHISRLSSSGSLLVSAPSNVPTTDSMNDGGPNRSIRLWDLTKPGEGEKKIGSTAYGVRAIKFSPDEKSMILILNNDDMQVWTSDFEKKVEVPGIAAATFSPDGKYVLTISTSITSQKMRKLNLEGATAGFNDVDFLLSDYEYVIRDISINETGNRVIVKGNQALWVVERGDGHSFFREVEGVNISPVVIKNFPRSQRFVEGAFVESNAIVTLNDLGEMYLWKDYPPFKSPDEAFKTIEVPERSEAEMLAADSVELNKMIAVSSHAKLDSLASGVVNLSNSTTNYEKRINYIDAAVKIYQRLSEITRGDERNKYAYLMLAYGDKVITSLRSRLSIDNVKTSSDNTEDIVSIVNRLRLNIAVRERLYKEKERDTLIAKELSGNYWNLSWYLLFVKDFDGAIAASGRGLDVWEKNNGMITNMALGYLLSGNFDEADKLYDQYKKESYKSDPDRKFRESFLQDLDDLQKAGIISTSNPQVYEHVEAIRKKLSAN